jgi:hypothetical protein
LHGGDSAGTSFRHYQRDAVMPKKQKTNKLQIELVEALSAVIDEYRGRVTYVDTLGALEYMKHVVLSETIEATT